MGSHSLQNLMKAVTDYCPELTQNFADNFWGTEIHRYQVKNPCSTAINSFQNANIKAGILLQGYLYPRPSESEFPHVLKSLGDSDTHFGFRATDTKKWLRKPVTIKDLYTIMTSYKSPS